MALKDDINALPTTVGEGSAGHLGNHATLHAGMKDHETRITTAEANKADKTALDARVPSNMALRLDTTVGTRIFAGNAMIHGDTGWRDVTSLLINGWKATAFRVKRTGDTVFWKVVGLSSTTATSRDFLSATAGISPGEFTLIKLGGVDIQVEWNGVARIASATYQGLLLEQPNFIMPTRNQAWPTVLPGLPA